MSEVRPKLKDLLKRCNRRLKEKYDGQGNFGRDRLRKEIKRGVGEFRSLNKLSQSRLKKFTLNRPMVGVDGSVNTLGKLYPHYIVLLQGLAKSTLKEEDGIIEHEIFSPLLNEDEERISKLANEDKISKQESASKIKTSLMAWLEVRVAIESIKKWSPTLVMMDGSLIRYKNEAEEEWDNLVEVALKEDVLLVGVIEEIGTHLLRDQLEDELPTTMEKMYDRELLFGLLKAGEMLKVDDGIDFKPSIQTAFLRTANDPGPIGIDMLKEQKEELELVADLVYTLTPKEGRGIPLWLDIVDEEVRISHKQMNLLIDNYFDKDLKQRLFHSKRLDRIY